jgi:hypothetical protein
MATHTCVCGHPSRLAEDGEHLRMTAKLMRGSGNYPARKPLRRQLKSLGGLTRFSYGCGQFSVCAEGII